MCVCAAEYELRKVTVEMIVVNLTQNAATAQRIISDVVAGLPQSRVCKCGSALDMAIITQRDAVPAVTRTELEPIIGRWLKS